MPAHLLLPLFASWLYVLAVLLVKRSSESGVGVYRTTFVANVMTGIVFIPLLLLHAEPFPGWNHVWEPAATALLFIGGQVLTFRALNKGDVSIATPILGVKIILVALFTTLLTADTVQLKLWISAAMSVAAIGLLNRGGATKHHDVMGTILAAGGAALVFALFDVFVQKYSPAWGAGRFLPIMMGMVAVFSLAFIPFFHAPLAEIPRPAWKWLGGGSFFMSAQAILFISTLAVYGKATASNIVYSSRGLWSVVAVWLIGHWFKNQEQQLGAAVLKWRLAGAALMLAAIVMVLVA